MKKFIALLLALTLTALLPVAALANEKIVVGATASPHAMILEQVKDDLAALGYDLEILELTDYNIGNPATAAGEINANYFQHIPFLDAYNASVPEDEQLVPAFGVHCEPYGIYPGTKKDLKDIAAGDRIAVTNGLIKLPDTATYQSNLTKEDIVETNGIEIYEVNAEMIPALLDDVAFAVINGNYVLNAGMTVKDDALFTEAEGVTGQVYTNYVVCRADDLEADWLLALKKVLYTQKVKDYILNNESFSGGVIPTFEVPEAE